jgi:hypothetical protein
VHHFLSVHPLSPAPPTLLGRAPRLLLLALAAAGCAGPDVGLIGELRGRTHVLRDVEDTTFEADLARRGIVIDPPAAGARPAGETGAASPPAADVASVAAFPLLFAERRGEGRFLELLWPIFETGRAPLAAAADTDPPVSRFTRLRPFLWIDDFRGGSRTILFPFYFRIREELEAGDRAIDHYWPFYGVHHEWIDLAPAVTHHVLYPLIYFRHGPERWKISVFPLFFASRGYYDRGWWLLPLLKVGTQGPNRFVYVIEPLFAYEHLSIAPSAEEDTEQAGRTRWSILGGLLGWENERGERSLRLLWFISL